MFTNSYSYYYYYYYSLSLSPPQDRHQQSQCANFFEHCSFVFFGIGYSQKRDFYNITVIISFFSAWHGLRVFNIIADFMGCSMVAGQRLSVQNSIVVLFLDIFMNFWLLSYRNLNRYVI